MDRFNLNAQLQCFHCRFPAGKRQPVIGITGNYGEQTCKLGEGYYKQIIAAGGTPLIIPPTTDTSVLLTTLDKIDALLLSGGADINPLFMGEEPTPRLGGINSERDLPELIITRLAFNRQMPILGICRGIQTLAVALGGSVAQDIGGLGTEGKHPLVKHSQEAERSEPTHSVKIEEHSILYDIFKGQQSSLLPPLSSLLPPLLFVNSFHHQAVSQPGPHFRVVATAPDGIVEAIESCEHKPIIGVQWHPECMGSEGLPLFKWLVNEAAIYCEVKEVHDRVLTLDTHCDTPMLFPHGIDFATRDDRLLVDLHKMTEGRLDATIMVAYLPQKGWKEENGEWTVVDDGLSATPKTYADSIFDRIEQIAAAHTDHLAIARTPADLWQNKQAGKKSIMLGIENGLALEHDLQNLQHFAGRGIVYITLCHNGDNDICDSAKGSQTYGGVSDFGAKVIREMNRLGIMVDLSHAHEKSFYDALDISSMPIVCSHSSARALCDHPRNLTDDQMRALAAKGGVCQITLYPGFLSTKSSEATILTAMQHLDHAIGIMGIDHVGLGSDFDGDGGVPGLANASELTNFTRQLLARRYSSSDIQKIWGGNFLRVMSQVQQQRL
jgi:microsomal dipeptidase-like Zn-dependent dipeptidase/gamma-glutamyl-gamma-aminobutyrate hydrolase PuuD